MMLSTFVSLFVRGDEAEVVATSCGLIGELRVGDARSARSVKRPR
jgi:hypothetical protein